MKKLNNKGFTTVEVIICFVIIVIITISLYSSITSFNEKRIIEGYKGQVYVYKNSLTKDIQDDLIKIGLTSVTKTVEITSDKITVYTVNCTLKDNTTRTLKVKQRLGYSSYHINGYKTGAEANDYFMIEYGPTGNEIEYPLPELGDNKIEADPDKGITEHTVKDLSLNNIKIDIKDDNVLSIYIGLYHPELTTRYAIAISVPINYITSNSSSSAWNY